MADKKLIKKRKAILSLLKRTGDSVSTMTNINKLKSKLEKIEECWEKFEAIQIEIEIAEDTNTTVFDKGDLGSADEEDQEEENREKFEEAYFDVVGALKSKIKEVSKLEPISEAKGIKNEDGNIKLPEISLPRFNGQCEKWLYFRDSFKSAIHDRKISGIKKFHYLKSVLQGDALRLIDSIELSEENYQVAWEILMERYDNRKVIILRHINLLFEQKSILKESAPAFRLLIEEIIKQLRILKTLGLSVEHWDPLIIHMVVVRLDPVTRREWECENKTLINELPTLEELKKFIMYKCQMLESVQADYSSTSNKVNNIVSVVKPNYFKKNSYVTSAVASSAVSQPSSQTVARIICALCNSDHTIYRCSKFLSLSVNDRILETRRLNLCFNCFSAQHRTKQCTVSHCKRCQKPHSTLLHLEFEKSKDNLPNNDQAQNNDSTVNTSFISNVSNKISKKNVLLSTAVVLVFGSNDKLYQCRILLDSGSQSNFMTEEVAQLLNLKRHKIVTAVIGINQFPINSNCLVNATIKSRFNSSEYNLDFVVLPKITNMLPRSAIDVSKWVIPSAVNLADPNFYLSNKVDMLIGAEVFFKLLCHGQMEISPSLPTLQNTSLGWILSGTYSRINEQKEQITAICCFSEISNEELDDQLTKFWDLEQCVVNPKFCDEQNIVEKYFIETVRRNESGRFVVKIPFKPSVNDLGESYSVAVRRLNALEQKFKRQPELKEHYNQFIEEYIQLGHMVRDQKPSNILEGCFLPHHAVIKPSSTTTRLRVVFDGSSKTSNGLSLNDIMHSGPAIQGEIFSLLIRFRKYKIALTSDITKMFRQINVDESDSIFQKILWRDNEQNIVVFRLTTVTYGTAAAPYLAIRCLKKLAEEEMERYPEASRVLDSDFYVDDLLTGCDSVQQAIWLRQQLSELLQNGCFELRKWCSNSSEVLEKIPVHLRSEKESVQIDSVSTLGIRWKPQADVFSYQVKEVSCQQLTKRNVLSDIAQIFDPLGLIGPVIVVAKMFIQKLWKVKLGWDEIIPTHLHSDWIEYRNQLSVLENISINRWIGSNEEHEMELHGFCDSSEAAYGACIYMKCIDKKGMVSVNLLCAKSRVAPTKFTTIPRLELCAAVLLVELFQKVKNSIFTNFSKIYFWTDAQIVLSWLAAPSSQWKTFVANQVAKIHEFSEGANWRHISGVENPADIISRGSSPEQLKHASLWWHGPSFLKSQESAYPTIKVQVDDIPEKRQCFLHSNEPVKFELLEKFSSWTKTIKVMAYVLRFINICRRGEPNFKQAISKGEMEKAAKYLFKLHQQQSFSREIQDLKEFGEVAPKSKLKSLKPYLDNDNLIRVGGRLINAEIHHDQKHQIIISSDSHLCEIIVIYEHIKNLHCGSQSLLSFLRGKFWIINARKIVRRITRSCIICFKAKPRDIHQIIGDLPASRITPNRPFLISGVDYCGPILIRPSNLRSSVTIKAYVAVFICFATKAIHIELVVDMSSQAFLKALRRFTARRGKCLHLYSDNGSNFVGAEKILMNIKKIVNEETQSKLLASEGITWHFIPPRSPHFGGLWEAGVKSIKYHLKRMTGEALLTYEELLTLLLQIEGCLNSRPISPISEDPSDLMPLTPGHFLVGDSLVAEQEPDIINVSSNRLKRWQLVQKLNQQIWKRWSSDYLNELQQSAKWHQKQENIKIGTMVLLKDENLPPTRWQVGRVLEVHPGDDGHIRVITIKTSVGVTKRAVTKVCPLPIDDISLLVVESGSFQGRRHVGNRN